MDDQIAERAIESGMEGERMGGGRRVRRQDEGRDSSSSQQSGLAAHLQADAVEAAAATNATLTTSAERTLQADRKSECVCYF